MLFLCEEIHFILFGYGRKKPQKEDCKKKFQKKLKKEEKMCKININRKRENGRE